MTGEGGVRSGRLGDQRGALTLGRTGILQGWRQRALVAVLVVELVVSLEDELARSQQLRGGLGGQLADRLGLAELPGEVAGAGRLGGAQGGGGADVREAGGGGREALAGFLRFVCGAERFVQRGAAGQEGPRRRRGRRDDGVVGLEGHPAAGDVLRREAHWRPGVGELNGRRYQSLERRGRWGALAGRRWDVFRP